MAYSGTIKVETSKLMSTAREFCDSARTVNQITNDMLNQVYDTCNGVWKGAAASKYLTKFNTLRDDMRRMYRMFEEHSRDLQEMARNYERAEQQNVNSFSHLQENPVQ